MIYDVSYFFSFLIIGDAFSFLTKLQLLLDFVRRRKRSMKKLIFQREHEFYLSILLTRKNQYPCKKFYLPNTLRGER